MHVQWWMIVMMYLLQCLCTLEPLPHNAKQCQTVSPAVLECRGPTLHHHIIRFFPTLPLLSPSPPSVRPLLDIDGEDAQRRGRPHQVSQYVPPSFLSLTRNPGATSLSATWQPNDERWSIVCRSLLILGHLSKYCLPSPRNLPC